MRPTASKTALLLQCGRPFGVEISEPEMPSEAARYGSAFHLLMAKELIAGVISPQRRVPPAARAALERYGLPPTPEAIAELVAHVGAALGCLQTWLAGENPWDVPWRIVSVECSAAINPRGGEPRACEFDEETHTYDLQDGEIGGTWDLLIESDVGRGVLDYKTGRYGNFHKPASLPQLRTLGLMTRANVLVILDTPPQGIPAIYAEEWTAVNTASHNVDLLTAVMRVGDGSLRPGPECKFCPARHDCPARGVEILQSAASLVGVANTALAVSSKGGPDALNLTVETAGKLHLLLTEFGRLEKLARTEIRSLVESGAEVVRPDGKRLELVSRTVERLSKKSVIEGLGKIKGEKMLEKLREAGALTETEETQLRAV